MTGTKRMYLNLATYIPTTVHTIRHMIDHLLP